MCHKERDIERMRLFLLPRPTQPSCSPSYLFKLSFILLNSFPFFLSVYIYIFNIFILSCPSFSLYHLSHHSLTFCSLFLSLIFSPYLSLSLSFSRSPAVSATSYNPVRCSLFFFLLFLQLLPLLSSSTHHFSSFFLSHNKGPPVELAELLLFG